MRYDARMRQFIEFIPIAVFVAVYFTTRDIYLATGALMAGVCCQVGYEYIKDKGVSQRTQSAQYAITGGTSWPTVIH